MKKLPKFHGYTVDFKLEHFGKVRTVRIDGSSLPTIEFIPFRAPKGERLLSRMIRETNIHSPYWHRLNWYLRQR